MAPSPPPVDLPRLKRWFVEAETLTQEARANSLRALDYYDSDQFSREDLGQLRERAQPPIVINRIKPAINGIIGVSERARSNPRAWPRNPGDGDSADVATDILRYIADFNRFKRLKQDCFRDLLIPGTMAALMGVDDDAQVTITQIRWEEFFHDPRSRRPDFKDARYLGIAKWMYAEDLAALYPDKDSAIDSAVANGPAGIGQSQAFIDRPMDGSGGGGAWSDSRHRRLLVIEIYYRDSGWKRCVFTGADILEQGDSPYRDAKGRPDCPIEAMSAYVKRDNSRYGPVWDMIGVQDEINKRRAKSLHLLSTSRIEIKDPSAVEVDAEVARREAARPDGVIPYGWGLAPGGPEFQGNMAMMAEAKAELERMGLSPAILGRSETDASGRALLARQQAGLVELAVLYGALEDWELRVYRQCWARAKQFWTAPQFIRVTDDEDAPRFVGVNQPIMAGPGAAESGVLGYANTIAEMDVDIEIDIQQDVATIAAEQFGELISLLKLSPAYQQQAPLSLLIQLSGIPHKRAILDQIKQAAEAQKQAATQARAAADQHMAAQIAKTQSEAQRNAAQGTAAVMNALSEAHAVHADGAAADLGNAQDRQAEAETEQQMYAPPGSQDG